MQIPSPTGVGKKSVDGVNRKQSDLINASNASASYKERRDVKTLTRRV